MSGALPAEDKPIDPELATSSVDDTSMEYFSQPGSRRQSLGHQSERATIGPRQPDAAAHVSKGARSQEAAKRAQ